MYSHVMFWSQFHHLISACTWSPFSILYFIPRRHVWKLRIKFSEKAMWNWRVKDERFKSTKSTIKGTKLSSSFCSYLQECSFRLVSLCMGTNQTSCQLFRLLKCIRGMQRLEQLQVNLGADFFLHSCKKLVKLTECWAG